ncbi:hypothetical protein EV121DRAFT_277971 [Schizophyllum commune]
MSSTHGELAHRPQPDKVLQDIANYVHNYKIDSELAYETARLCLIDTIGCGLEGLRFPACTKLLGPVVEGTVVPNGTKVFRTNNIGGLVLLNSFDRVGLDHVVLVKVASTAVVSKMLGLTRDQTVDAISQAFVDGQSLRTYRHAPNTGPRKSWAAGDACSRAVNLALLVQKGEKGLPSVLTAKTWGFYDVLFKGRPFEFQQPFGSYIMENVLFKISFPAEFHAQTAVEAALILHERLKALGKTAEDIKAVRIRTQEAAVDKQGPLDNFADRDHAISYMVAYPLIFGELTSESYTDEAAADPRIDALRAKIFCVEDKRFSVDYHDPAKRSIGNALLVELNDGTVLDEVEIEYPVGHKRRRAEGTPLLMNKFQRHISHHFDTEQQKRILDTVTDAPSFAKLPVDKFTELFIKQ